MELENFQFKEELLQVLKAAAAAGDNNQIHLPATPMDTAIFQELKDLLTSNGAVYKKRGNIFLVDAGDADKLLEACINTMQQEIDRTKEPEPKKERRVLRYDFTQDERNDMAQQLASETKKLSALEDEKASVMAQYGAKIKEGKATQNRLSNLIADGYELRDVDVEILYHKPVSGRKTIVRKDTGTSFEERMESWEYNLFNQPKEETEDELR